MKKYSILFLVIYFVISIYFAIFNWEVFIIAINVNLGFALLNIPPFIIIFLIGLILLGGISMIGYVTEVKHEIEILKKNSQILLMRKNEEINSLKNSYYNEQSDQFLKNSDDIKSLKIQIDKLMKLISVDDEKRKLIPSQKPKEKKPDK